MPDAPAILLYDGECGFCTRSVLFVYRRDPHGRFRFAALASPAGQRLLAEHGARDVGDTMVLVDADGVHVRSTAALRVAAGLRRPWPWLAALGRLVPRRLRDAAYGLVAANRHRLRGPARACAAPEPALRRRMLE